MKVTEHCYGAHQGCITRELLTWCVKTNAPFYNQQIAMLLTWSGDCMSVVQVIIVCPVMLLLLLLLLLLKLHVFRC